MLSAAARRLATVTLLCGLPHVALANDVTLVDADPVWRDAVSVALEPWGSRVRVMRVPTSVEALSPSERGAQLAARDPGQIFVWFEPIAEGSVLWVYDRARRSVEGRELPIAPPLDAMTAAALALSLKTTLRHHGLDPESRDQVSTAPPSDAPPPRPLSPSGALPTGWMLGVSLGGRTFGEDPLQVEPRASVLAAYWPAALDGFVGVGLRTSGGIGIPTASPLDGRWLAVRSELALMARFVPIAPLELGVWGGAGVSVTRLSGTVRPNTRSVEDWRAIPALSGGLQVGFAVTRIFWVGLRSGVDLLPWRQRYLVRGAPVLGAGNVGWLVELGAAIALGP